MAAIKKLSKKARLAGLQEVRQQRVRASIQAFQKRVSGKFTKAEWEELTGLALEWAGHATVKFSDGSRGIIRGNSKLVMLLDALHTMAVVPDPPGMTDLMVPPETIETPTESTALGEAKEQMKRAAFLEGVRAARALFDSGKTEEAYKSVSDAIKKAIAAIEAAL